MTGSGSCHPLLARGGVSPDDGKWMHDDRIWGIYRSFGRKKSRHGFNLYRQCASRCGLRLSDLPVSLV